MLTFENHRDFGPQNPVQGEREGEFFFSDFPGPLDIKLRQDVHKKKKNLKECSPKLTQDYYVLKCSFFSENRQTYYMFIWI